jgi:diguanylate cyclase (GGDEF)-like protein
LLALRLESVKAKIIVFALLATLIPSMSTAWISYGRNRQSLTEKTAEELQSVGSQTAREMDLWIRDQLHNLRVFASSYEVTENLDLLPAAGGADIVSTQASVRLSDYLSSVQQLFPDYDEILVIDHATAVVASSSDSAGAVSLPPNWLEELQADDAVDKAILGAPYWDQHTEHAVLTIAVPIGSPAGPFLGAMAARLKINSVDSILQSYSPGESGQAYLITPAGHVITSSRMSSAQLMNMKLPETAVRNLLAMEGTAIEYTDYLGTEVVGTLRRIPRLSWALVAEIPIEEAYAQVARLRNVTLVVVATLLLGVGVIAYVLALVIVRPLDRLTAGAREVAAGDLSVGLPVIGRGEVSYLTEVFNDMVTKLRTGREELDAANETLTEQNEALERLSVTDGLTGLFNRRQLMETLAKESQRTRRHKRPFTVLMLDVDHFKKCNDNYGHLIGDDVLKKLGSILKGMTRDVDFVARYGGEEFVVLLLEAGQDGGTEVAERIRDRIAAETFTSGKEEFNITVSIGVAECSGVDPSPDAVISRADRALYQAKRQGRNRVARADSRSGQRGKTSSS